MVTKRFHCRNCGNDFEMEVFEPGEAEREKRPVSRVHCPRCNRTDVDEHR